MASKNEKVRLSLDLTQEVNDIINSIAEKYGVTKGEILRKSLAIFVAAAKEKEDRNLTLGFFDSNKKLVSEIIGI